MTRPPKGPTKPPIVLDTCVLGDKDFLRRLSSFHGRKIISSISYMEFCYFLLSSGKDTDGFRDLLKALGITIEHFGIKNADKAVGVRLEYGRTALVSCPECGKQIKADWCDLMIASHALDPPWIVVTKNVKDFDYLKDRVMSPQEFMERYGSKRV